MKNNSRKNIYLVNRRNSSSKILIIFMILFFFLVLDLFAYPSKARIAIYTTGGVDSEKILSVFRAVSSMGYKIYGISRQDIKMGRLNLSNFDVLVLPSGENGNKRIYDSSDLGIGSKVIVKKIRNFINNGGGFVGFEAGADFACCNSKLKLFKGQYNKFTNQKTDMCTCTIIDPMFGAGKQDCLISSGSGYFTLTGSEKTIAVNFNKQPVAIRSYYNSGRVILTSLDMSLRADSTQDWTIWDNYEMNGTHRNSKGVWVLFGRMIDWAAGGKGDKPVITSENNGIEKIAVITSYSTYGGGAWPGLIPAIGRSIEFSGHIPLAIRYKDIKKNKLTIVNFNTVVFPGGSAYGYKIGLRGYEMKIRNFIKDGGGYLGICAGSFYAAESIVWENMLYDYPLDIFSGQDIGPINDIAQWPGYTLTPVRINDPIIGNFGMQNQLYYGGGYKTSSENYSVVSTYEYNGTYKGYENAVRFIYGNGHVLLIGTHPEARNGSDEDWLYWNNFIYGGDDFLINDDNPWNFVKAAFNNWLTI